MSATSIYFNQEPQGVPDPATTFAVKKVDVPEPADGEALVKLVALSVDPYLRGRMRVNVKSYSEPLKLNEPMISGTVVEVVSSKNDKLKTGQLISLFGPWTSQYILTPQALAGGQVLQPGITPELALSVLGLTGLTAYCGLEEIGKIKEGETVVVSGAAGATGLVVVQIAKLKGARVIGIAGGPDKCAFVKSLGADEVIDYREDKVRERLDEYAPDGIDVYWDNVGGDILAAAFGRLRDFSRVIQCGAISAYNATDKKAGEVTVPLSLIISRRITWRGFIVRDFASLFPQAFKDMSAWLKEGKLKSKVTITQGLENAPHAFAGLFEGKNTGKAIVLV